MPIFVLFSVHCSLFTKKVYAYRDLYYSELEENNDAPETGGE